MVPGPGAGCRFLAYPVDGNCAHRAAADIGPAPTPSLAAVPRRPDLRRAGRVARRLVLSALPAVTVATLIPLALFYIALVAGSVLWAIGVSVAYAYGVAAYQYIRSGRVSGMLLVTMFTATIRAVAAAASGQVMVYFAVPVLETAGFGLMFALSMLTSEPLIVRLARDFVPHLADDLARRPALIRALSLIWTLTYMASGATTLVLLTTQSVAVYMGTHELAGWCWTGSGVALSVAICRRRARGLLAAALAHADPSAALGAAA